MTRKQIDLLAPPFAGHLHPILGMARALREEHDVQVLTTRAGEASVRAAGVNCAVLLDGWDEALSAVIDTPKPVRGNPIGLLRQLSAAMRVHQQVRIELDARYSDLKPDLLIADFTLIAAGPVAQTRGIPWWTSLPSPCILEGGDGPPCYMGGLTPNSGRAGRLRDRAGWGLIHTFKALSARLFRRELRQLGIDSLYREDGSEATYSDQRILAIGWQELEFRRQWPPQVTFIPPVLYTPPSPVPAPCFKVRGTHILFTLGTHLKAAKAGFLEAAQALAAHAPGIEIHFSDGALTGTQSSRQTNFQRLSSVNYDAHIKQYDVVIHHGGTGIMNHCLGNGIPAIVYPMDYDQFDYAARLEYAGLAKRLRRIDQLPSLVNECLNDSELKLRCLAFAARNTAALSGYPLKTILTKSLTASH